MDLYTQIIETFPGAVFIGKDYLEDLPGLLKRNGWIGREEEILLVEKPGEGNMNFVLRVKTNLKSFIVKQSRPWVEKYPTIEAPIEHVEVEALFYDMLKQDPFYHNYTPRLMGYDRENYLLAVEDLGESADYTYVYQKNQDLDINSLKDLMEFVSRLHTEAWRIETGVFPSNYKLKKLNHEHIFNLPYREHNGFDLDAIQEGLQDISLPYRKNTELKGKISELGEIYLGKGAVLIHGDYYPGSWLQVNNRVKVIDPEFAHFGQPEFDMGVMAAHMKMSQMGDEDIIGAFRFYKKPAQFNPALFSGFCGVEILRRIIGLAQLPLDMDLEEKSSILEWASGLILKPVVNPFFK